MKRRRFLQIFAAATLSGRATQAARWQGRAFGADINVTLRGGDMKGSVANISTGRKLAAAGHSSRGEDVVATLDRACWVAGYPKTIRVDQGSEFISRDMGLWAYQRGVTFDFSRHGKPTDNAFNGSFRAGCLNTRRHCHLDQWRNNDDVLTPADAAERATLDTTMGNGHTARAATRPRSR